MLGLGIIVTDVLFSLFYVSCGYYTGDEPVIQSLGTFRKASSILRHLLNSHGLPHLFVSDNASAFRGDESQQFLAKNGIRHVGGAPHHPGTNGLAENAATSFKETTKKTDGYLASRLDPYLFDYRLTPLVTTGIPPCEPLMGRRFKTRFDLLKPSLNDKVHKKQEIQARERD